MNKSSVEEYDAIAKVKDSIRRGSYQKALDQIEVVLANNNSSSTGWKLKTNILIEMNDVDSAIDAVNKAIEANRDDPHCHVLRAQLNKKMGRCEKSLADVNTCLDRWPKNIGLISLKVDLLSVLKRYKDFFELAKYIKYDEDLSYAIPINMALARFLYSYKRLRASKNILYYILGRNRDHANAHSLLKEVVLQELKYLSQEENLENIESIKSEYKNRISIDHYAETLRLFANYLISNKNYSLAEKNVKELICIDKKNSKTLSLEAKLDVIYGQPMKAYRQLKKVLSGWYGEEELILVKIDVITKINAKTDCFGLLDAIRSNYTSYPKLLMSAARLFFHFKRYNVALKLVSVVLDSYPRHVLANKLKLTIVAEKDRKILYKYIFDYSELNKDHYDSHMVPLIHHSLSLARVKELGDDQLLLTCWLRVLRNLSGYLNYLNENEVIIVLKKYKQFLSSEDVLLLISNFYERGIQADHNILWMIQNIEKGVLENIAGFMDKVNLSQHRSRALTSLSLELTLLSDGPQAALDLLRTKRTQYRSPVEANKLARFLMLADTRKLSLRYLRFCKRKWPDNIKINIQFAHALFDRGYPRLAIGVLNKVNSLNIEAINLKVFCLLEINEVKKAGLQLTKKPLTSSTELLMTRSQFFILNREPHKAKALLHRGYEQGHEANYLGPHASLSLIGSLLNDLELYELEVKSRTSTIGVDELFLRYTHPSIKLVEKYVKDGAPVINGKTGYIPRSICQYWDKANPPEFVKELMATWSKQYNYDYKLYNKVSAASFISGSLGKKFVKAFRLANNPAEEADFFRLCYLKVNGGIYADADDSLYGDLDRLIPAGVKLLCFREQFGALANNFIAVSPHHPVIDLACDLAAESLLLRDNESTWQKTGPGLFTRVVAYHLSHSQNDVTDKSILICPLYRLKREVKLHMKLPHKNSNNYWNSSSSRKLSIT